jgi:uncharacterized protein YdiU (UPF0061 family)
MIIFENTFSQFPAHFYSKTEPANFKNPKLLSFNFDLAKALGLNELCTLNPSELSLYFSGQKIFETGSYISAAYSGHQFGHFNPTLGDGRAVLIGETPEPNKVDIQLKGSGPTEYSRRGDGMSALGPVIREYLVSESMYYLNIPTTRALCACYTGQSVSRQTLEPGGVFTRVASSHLRIGNFEYLAANHDSDGLKNLLHYSIKRHYPELDNTKQIQPLILDFLKAVSIKQSTLIAKWMSVGFIHGVMNTDNMSIAGETIDFGPCAFMDHYKKDRVYSFIDQHKRYAFNNQPSIGLWNLYQLANSFVSFFNTADSRDLLEQTLEACHSNYTNQYRIEMAKKFGINEPTSNDDQLMNLFFQALEEDHLDFTESFITLTYDSKRLEGLKTFKKFFSEWNTKEVSKELMKKVNPYLIPRNHHMEKIIKDVYSGDETSFQEYLQKLKSPFDSNNKSFLRPPNSDEIVQNTFCGT